MNKNKEKCPHCHSEEKIEIYEGKQNLKEGNCHCSCDEMHSAIDFCCSQNDNQKADYKIHTNNNQDESFCTAKEKKHNDESYIKNHQSECCCCEKHNHYDESYCSDTHIHNEVECCKSLREKNTDESCCSSDHPTHIHSDECACGCGGQHISSDYATVTKGKMLKNTQKQLVKLLVSFVFLVVGFFDWKTISGGQGFLMAFYYVNPSWVALILCGTPLFRNAIISLKNKKLKVPVLVSVAMLASIGLEIAGFFVDLNVSGHNHSYVFAAGEIAFLMTLGGWIESLTVKKCKSGIQRLVNLIPKEAFVKVGDTLEKRSLKDIAIGDIVVCKSGEMIAVDGEIIKGNCSVDQSSVTGEYVPVDLKEGDKVFGGTMNVNGTVEIIVQKLLKDMTVAKMAELVKEAEGKKAPIARIADKWVSYIIPSLFLVSPVVGLLSYYVLNAGVVESVIRAITVLIVFCPCAFALATPTAIAAGLGNGAKNGVLIKSGESLEELNRIKTVCFDKTGTLTEGKLSVSDIKAYGMDEKDLLRLTASVEKYSEHPLSQAIVRKTENISLAEASDIQTISGVGINGIVNGKQIKICSYKIAEELLNEEQLVLSKELMEQGKTVVCVIIDGQISGIIALSDTIRKGAKELIFDLKAKGYETVMLTGDHYLNAKFVADSLGIDSLFSDLMPEDKMRAIKQMQTEGKKVFMLGDGINDAPSLKLADVSIAMGGVSSDIALDSANMALLNNDIKKVGYTLNLSKRVMRTIITNIIIAMTINFVALALSLFGILNPVTGALMHNCTSIFVVMCSAFLLITPKRFLK